MGWQCLWATCCMRGSLLRQMHANVCAPELGVFSLCEFIVAGDYNKLYDNRCDSLIGGSFCVYVAPEVKRTVVGCTYNAASTKALVCNCQASTRCGRSAGPPNFVAGYEVPGMDTDDEWRPSWD